MKFLLIFKAKACQGAADFNDLVALYNFVDKMKKADKNLVFRIATARG